MICTVHTVSFLFGFFLSFHTNICCKVHTVRMVIVRCFFFFFFLCLSCRTYGCFLWVVWVYVLSPCTFEVVRMVVIRLYFGVFVGGLSVRTVTMLRC